MNLHGKTDDCHDKYNITCKNQENVLVFFNNYAKYCRSL